MNLQKSGLLAAALLVAALLLPAAGADAAKGEPSFFRSVEFRSSNMKAFKKWQAAIARYSREQALLKTGTCKSKTLNACHYKKLQTFVAALKGKNVVDQVRLVNSQINKAKYISDANNWGRQDYWASPGEFMARFGDCEDFAIAKYVVLKMLGFEEDDLRVVAVKDMNLKIGHAVLVVYLKGQPYVLDNQIKSILPASKIRHYQPVFSINQKFWWKHKPG